MVELMLTILLLLMIIGAIIAIETKKLLSAIVSVGAIGFLLSIAFLFLGAPDIAITQVVVEILCLVILIRATINRDLTAVSGDREFFGMAVTVVLLIALMIFSVMMFNEKTFDEKHKRGVPVFPPFGSSVMDRFKTPDGRDIPVPSKTYVREGMERTGAANIVTAILLDFRAYDTLGEATVLFCAILGALAVLRQKARKRRDEQDEESDAA
jgi:multisubunit Na+/H+ antiporter MnhB subunit